MIYYLHIKGFVFPINHGCETRCFHLTVGRKINYFNNNFFIHFTDGKETVQNYIFLTVKAPWRCKYFCWGWERVWGEEEKALICILLSHIVFRVSCIKLSTWARKGREGWAMETDIWYPTTTQTGIVYWVFISRRVNQWNHTWRRSPKRVWP